MIAIRKTNPGKGYLIIRSSPQAMKKDILFLQGECDCMRITSDNKLKKLI